MPENLVMAGDYKNCKIQYNEIVLPFFEACALKKKLKRKAIALSAATDIFR